MNPKILFVAMAIAIAQFAHSQDGNEQNKKSPIVKSIKDIDVVGAPTGFWPDTDMTKKATHLKAGIFFRVHNIGDKTVTVIALDFKKNGEKSIQVENQSNALREQINGNLKNLEEKIKINEQKRTLAVNSLYQKIEKIPNENIIQDTLNQLSESALQNQVKKNLNDFMNSTEKLKLDLKQKDSIMQSLRTTLAQISSNTQKEYRQRQLTENNLLQRLNAEVNNIAVSLDKYKREAEQMKLEKDSLNHVLEKTLKAGAKENKSDAPKPAGHFNSEYYNDKFYTISKNDFNDKMVEVKSEDRMSVGLLTLPFKARPQDGVSFDTEYNLNGTFNIRLASVAQASLNLQVGAGIGSVGLNSSNVHPNGTATTEPQDVAVLTWLAGTMIQYKKVQVGLYAGVDYINNQEQYHWKNNGNLWIGFGIGFNVFQISVSPVKNQPENDK